jgi:hypothetical protein
MVEKMSFRSPKEVEDQTRSKELPTDPRAVWRVRDKRRAIMAIITGLFIVLAVSHGLVCVLVVYF